MTFYERLANHILPYPYADLTDLIMAPDCFREDRNLILAIFQLQNRKVFYPSRGFLEVR